MIICDCKKHLEFDHTRDVLYPYGDIESIAVFKCSVCGREYDEEELAQKNLRLPVEI